MLRHGSGRHSPRPAQQDLHSWRAQPIRVSPYYTDLEKDGACRPCYIPVVGFHGRSWVDGLLISMADVAIAGFLLKEDDSTNGDPFLASKFKRRPKRGRRVTKCVREILVMVCDVPRAQVGKFRISSFRKFMPTIAKLLKLRVIAMQTSVGGLVVSLKRTNLFLKTDLPASSQLARLCFQTNMHQKLQLCRFVRLCVFLSENARGRSGTRRYQPPPYRESLSWIRMTRPARQDARRSGKEDARHSLFLGGCLFGFYGEHNSKIREGSCREVT